MVIATWRPIVGLLEALSYIALMGIAMPLKYIWDQPQAVSVVGMVHGVLWSAYMLLVFTAWQREVITLRWAALLAGLSLIPIGPLLVDGRLRSAADSQPQPQPAG